jgi:hypothetical protein
VQILGRVATVAASGNVQGLISAPSALGTAWLQNQAVTTGKIADQAATTAKIADANVTLAKLESRARPNFNFLINGGFNFFQRQAPATPTSRTDTQFGPDRWRVLSQTAALNVSRGSGDVASRHCLTLAQPQAAAQRMGISQAVEAVNAMALRGRAVTFQARIRCSASQAIRCAILEGLAEDNVPADVINSWTSTDYTDGAGKFFNNTNLDIIANAALTPAAGVWNTISVTATLSLSLTNLVVVLWTEGTAAQNVTLEICEAGLYDGSEARDWLPRPIAEELALCKRYYQKTFAIDTAPVDNPGTTVGAIQVCQSVGAGILAIGPAWEFSVAMRITPALTYFNPQATGAQCRNLSGASNCTNTATSQSSPDRVVVQMTSAAASAAGNTNAIHITADAEL